MSADFKSLYLTQGLLHGHRQLVDSMLCHVGFRVLDGRFELLPSMQAHGPKPEAVHHKPTACGVALTKLSMWLCSSGNCLRDLTIGEKNY